MEDDDLIIARLTNETPVTEPPALKIWLDGPDSYSFASKFNPVQSAKILSGLLKHILETEIG